MTILVAFGVNVGNLGSVSKPRVPMRVLVPRINATLELLSSPARIVASYRHTGNFVISSNDRSPKLIAQDLTVALGTRCVVTRRGEFCTFVEELRTLKPPRAQSGIRWTPGGVFLVAGPPNRISLKSTNLANFRRSANGHVFAWKRDVLDSSGRLDRSRRNGGWGGLAVDVAKQLDGTAWTARSISTLEGLLRRAQEAE